MDIVEEIKLRKPLNWSDRLILHIQFGHIPTDLICIGTTIQKGKERSIYQYTCLICGKQIEERL